MKFPGVGPRQARRFVYYLLGKNGSFVTELNEALQKLSKEMRLCESCFRYFHKENGNSSPICSICLDQHRDENSLLIVSGNVDLESIEKSGYWHGRYFVLGGIIPILEKNPERRIKLKELKQKIEKEGKKKTLKEIILALNTTPEGENTSLFLQSNLETLLKEYGIKISILGRGLSTGAELEYADSETIKNALQNRH